MKTFLLHFLYIVGAGTISSAVLLVWLADGIEEIRIDEFVSFSILMTLLFCLYYPIVRTLKKRSEARRYGLVLNEKTRRFLERAGVIPQLTYTYAYVLAFGVALVLVLNFEVFALLYSLLALHPIAAGTVLAFVLGLFGRGMFYVLLLSVLPSQMIEARKVAIKSFVLLVLAFLSIAVAVYSVASVSIGYLILVPWHLFQMGVLLSLVQTRHHDPSRYVDIKKSSNTKMRVFVGMIVAASVLLTAEYVFTMHWAVALSALTVVWNMVENMLNRISPSRKE